MFLVCQFELHGWLHVLALPAHIPQLKVQLWEAAGEEHHITVQPRPRSRRVEDAVRQAITRTAACCLPHSLMQIGALYHRAL
jgi:hypothetical protein